MPELLNIIELRDQADFQAGIEQQRKADDAKKAASMMAYKLGDMEHVVSMFSRLNENTRAKDATSELVRMYRQGREDAFRMAAEWLLPHLADADLYAKKTLEALER